MHLTQDEEDPEDLDDLILLEDALGSTLAQARAKLGSLLWGEDVIIGRLTKAISDFKAKEDRATCTVFVGLLHEARQRKEKIYQVSASLKEAEDKRKQKR